MRLKILVVDELPLRGSFLCELLEDLGDVVQFFDPHKALEALGYGLPVEMAVVAYSHHAVKLIKALGSRGSRILAFGNQRTAPTGVDHYLLEPLLAHDVYKTVEIICSRRKGKSKSNGVRS